MGLFSLFKKSSKDSPSDSYDQETSDTKGKQDAPRGSQLKADTLKYDALRALKIGEVDFAIRALRTSLQEIDDPEARLYLAQALQRKPDLASAMAELSQILQIYPDYSMALYEATKVSVASDQYAEAITYARRALETDLEISTQAELLRIMAQAQIATNEYPSALATIEQALDLTSEIPLYWLIKVKVLISLERWSDALGIVDEVVKRFPEEERGYLYEGMIAYHKGDHMRAERAFRQVVDTDPFNEEGYMHLTHLVAELHGIDSAANEMKSALELLPQPTRAILEYASQLYHQAGYTDWYDEVQQQLSELTDEGEGLRDETNFSNLYAGGLY